MLIHSSRGMGPAVPPPLSSSLVPVDFEMPLPCFRYLPKAASKVTLPPACNRTFTDPPSCACRPQVTSSVSSEAVSMSELKRWNDQYGEGGSRRTETLHYFT
jgi:hypothetical protein